MSLLDKFAGKVVLIDTGPGPIRRCIIRDDSFGALWVDLVEGGRYWADKRYHMCQVVGKRGIYVSHHHIVSIEPDGSVDDVLEELPPSDKDEPLPF